MLNDGIDSRMERIRSCQYNRVAFVSEKIKDKNGLNSDSDNSRIKKITASASNMTEIIKATDEKDNRFLSTTRFFSIFRRLIMRAKSRLGSFKSLCNCPV